MTILRIGNIEPPPDGFYPGVPEAEYRQWDALNISLLKWCAHSMEKFKHEADHPSDNDTPAKADGRLFHTCLWEPGELSKRHVPQPRVYPVVSKEKGSPGAVSVASEGLSYDYAWGRGESRESVAIEPYWSDDPGGWEIMDYSPDTCLSVTDTKWSNNATWCKRWIAGHAADGREVVSANDLAKSATMANRLRAMKDFEKIVDGAQFEVSIVWTDEATGLRCKARLDCWQPHVGQIGDAKKTAFSADWESFAKAMRNFKYYVQAAFYRDGASVLLEKEGKALPEVPKFRLCVVEDFPPYCPAIYTLADHQQYASWQWLDAGRRMYHGWLQSVKYSIERDFWPGHNPSPEDGEPEEMELEVPEWCRL